jgi:hypothetical protein
MISFIPRFHSASPNASAPNIWAHASRASLMASWRSRPLSSKSFNVSWTHNSAFRFSVGFSKIPHYDATVTGCWAFLCLSFSDLNDTKCSNPRTTKKNTATPARFMTSTVLVVAATDKTSKAPYREVSSRPLAGTPSNLLEYLQRGI